MPVEPGSAMEAATKTVRAWYWIATNPWVWLLVAGAIWNGISQHKAHQEDNAKRWREENAPR
jgi:hypothetical protein